MGDRSARPDEAPAPGEDFHRQLLEWGGQRRPEVPECPAGWETGPPDIVGVGAPRCGSSWWFRQITKHPEVCYETGLHSKEVHFFDDLGGVGDLGPGDVERYSRYFPRPPGGGLTCEWTPRYMIDPWTMGQLRKAAPEARILVILRDPVARYGSAYALHERRARRGAPPDGAIEAQVGAGMYFRQVRRVLAAYPADQVLILQYERCRLDYEGQLDRTYEFLGLSSGFRPAQGTWSARDPETPPDFHQSSRGRVLGELYASDAERLAELVPEIDLTLWPGVQDLG